MSAACAEGAIDDPASFDDVEYSGSELKQPNWMLCASQGEWCDFSGTRLVRYGKNNKYVTGTFSDGVQCTASSFGRRRGSGSCWYDGGSGSSGAAGSGAMDTMQGSQSAAGSGDASASSTGSTTTTTTTTSNSSSTTADHTTQQHSGSTGTAAGPYVDMSALPSGDPGSSRVQIESTSEQPAGSDGTGAFRNECTFSHMAKDDPIVFPGEAGRSHLHAFFGNTGANAGSTQDSLRNSGNSTCRGGIANRTSYWVPAVVDAAGKPVKPRALEVYYKSGYNGIKASDIKPFPSGLRMIAGDAKSSGPQSMAYWGCAGHYIGHPSSIPNCQSGDEVQMTVVFPQCWDGVNLDSSDHKSHMAYPQKGSCPSTHPVPIPEISFGVRYTMPSSGSTAGWRLVSDMYDPSLPAGMSAHADWFEGWDPAVVKAFVAHCINPAVDCHSHLLGDGRRIY